MDIIVNEQKEASSSTLTTIFDISYWAFVGGLSIGIYLLTLFACSLIVGIGYIHIIATLLALSLILVGHYLGNAVRNHVHGTDRSVLQWTLIAIIIAEILTLLFPYISWILSYSARASSLSSQDDHLLDLVVLFVSLTLITAVVIAAINFIRLAVFNVGSMQYAKELKKVHDDARRKLDRTEKKQLRHLVKSKPEVVGEADQDYHPADEISWYKAIMSGNIGFYALFRAGERFSRLQIWSYRTRGAAGHIGVRSSERVCKIQPIRYHQELRLMKSYQAFKRASTDMPHNAQRTRRYMRTSYMALLLLVVAFSIIISQLIFNSSVIDISTLSLSRVDIKLDILITSILFAFTIFIAGHILGFGLFNTQSAASATQVFALFFALAVLIILPMYSIWLVESSYLSTTTNRLWLLLNIYLLALLSTVVISITRNTKGSVND